MLLDGAATQKAMQAGITSLVRGAKKGDVLVLHYSGHGSNVPDDDKNKDEADGRDEILCPTDLNWDKPLRDDWLRTTFDKLPAGVSFTIIMDCCHSGTNTRAILPPDVKVKQRYLPSPWGLAAAESGRSLPKKVSSELRRSSRSARKTKDIVNAELPEVLITGCRDTQTSADAFINGRYQRSADVRARRGHSQEQRASHVPAVARSRGRGAEGQEVRAGAAARGTDVSIRGATLLSVNVVRSSGRDCKEISHVETRSVPHVSATVSGSACFAFRGRRLSLSSSCTETERI